MIFVLDLFLAGPAPLLDLTVYAKARKKENLLRNKILPTTLNKTETNKSMTP